MNDTSEQEKIKKLHLEFAEQRGFESTYCPSEVARVYQPDSWREFMDDVRKVADTLVEDGKLIVMQNGKKNSILPSEAKGPIRLRKNK